jgi:NAD(P)H-nitrite reductase large subunit
MMANKQIEQLRSLGYDVGVAFEGYDDIPDVLSISGFGTDVQLSSDDGEALDRLLNPEAHKSRLLQTTEVSTDEAIRADLAAQVSLGDVTQKEADVVYETATAEPETVVTVEALSSALNSLPDGGLTKQDLVSALKQAVK